MLKKRIIPTLLYKDFGLVKGKKFDNSRRVGPVLPAINIYNNRGVDELIFLDIVSTIKEEEPDYEQIKDFSKYCFVPLTVGGGIKKKDQVQRLLEAGADKITINSAAYTDKNLIEKVSNNFGSQCVVASVDYRNEDGKYICYSHSGNIKTGEEVLDWVKSLENMGSGEIIVNNIDKDGTMQGYDLEVIKKITEVVNIPVIASGGAGEFQDMYKAIYESNAAAVAAASIFHFTEKTPAEAKLFLQNKGIDIRRNFSIENV